MAFDRQPHAGHVGEHVAGRNLLAHETRGDADAEHHLPLTELNISDHLKTGTTTICTIWPDPGGDTIALDHPDGKYAVKDTAYRLTDIPIKNS